MSRNNSVSGEIKALPYKYCDRPFCAETFQFTCVLRASMSITKVVSEEKVNFG